MTIDTLEKIAKRQISATHFLAPSDDISVVFVDERFDYLHNGKVVSREEAIVLLANAPGDIL